MLRKMYKLILAMWAMMLIQGCLNHSAEPNPDGSYTRVSISRDDVFGIGKKVVFENDLFRGCIRTKQREDHLVENAGGKYMTCIMDWMLKRDGIDQVSWGVNASEHWTELDHAEVVHDSADCTTVRLWKTLPEYALTYTFYPGSPFIRIEFLTYKNPLHGWFNVVDLGEPGGQARRENAQVYLFGQEDYIREIVYWEDSYWNTFADDGQWDPADGGSLNYKGHIISVVENPLNHSGYGRIMPIRTGTRAGSKILKLINNQGFEHFITANDPEEAYQPFTTWVFLFSHGYKQAIQDACLQVDQALRP